MSNLEKPPGVASAKQTKSQDSQDQITDQDHDTNKGLYSDVYKVEGNDKSFVIKRKVDDAWILLGKAIRLNKFKIAGKNQKNGSYKVSFKSGGILDGFSLFGDTKASMYLLQLDEQADETKVNISKIEDEGDVDPGRLMDGAPDFSYDNSAKLLEILFSTLQKEVPL